MHQSNRVFHNITGVVSFKKKIMLSLVIGEA
jgi:hypothetical protein